MGYELFSCRRLRANSDTRSKLNQDTKRSIGFRMGSKYCVKFGNLSAPFHMCTIRSFTGNIRAMLQWYGLLVSAGTTTVLLLLLMLFWQVLWALTMTSRSDDPPALPTCTNKTGSVCSSRGNGVATFLRISVAARTKTGAD